MIIVANTGGPAFPFSPSDDSTIKPQLGMTLRDYFAGQAIIAYHSDGEFSDSEDVANWCYRLADAMLEARKE
jgi:hypothetical protein